MRRWSLEEAAQTLVLAQACDFPLNGQGYYRYHEPMRHLAHLDGISAIDCDPLHPFFSDISEISDVLILQQYDSDWASLIEARRAKRRITIVEVSDYYFDFQPWHASAKAWSDQFRRDALIRLVERADGVQTTTEPLADHLRRWNRQVRVFPNQLSEIPDLQKLPNRPLVIGWAGSGSHLADWRSMAPVVAKWVEKTDNAKLHVMCEEAARGMVHLPPEKYQFTPSGSLGEYLLFLRGLDVGLAPLLRGEFNRCRSDLKYLEYAASGVVGIYQKYPPFSNSVVPGVTGFLFDSVAEMLAHLDNLSTNHDLRLKVRDAAHEAVAAGRRLANHVSSRIDFYKSLLPNSRVRASVSAEWEKAALKDGRYWQIRPGRVERAIAALKKQPGHKGAVSELMRVSAQFPDHVQAQIHLAAHWLEAGSVEHADAAIRLALQRQPDNIRALAIAAAIREAQGDISGAIEVLVRAIDIDSGLVRVWSSLLTLLAQRPSAEAFRLAKKALELFPANRAIQVDAHRILLKDRPRSLVRLRQLLEIWSTTPTGEPRTHWIIPLGHLCESVLSEHRSDSDLIPFLELAHAVTPESFRITSCLARALDAAGRFSESAIMHIRISKMSEEADLWRAEFPSDDQVLQTHLIAADAEKRVSG